MQKIRWQSISVHFLGKDIYNSSKFLHLKTLGKLDLIKKKKIALKKTYSFGEAAVEADAEAALLIVLSNKDEHLRANSKASIQHRPAALFGALKMQCEVGRG